MPLASILVPVRNGADFIADALDSAGDQDYADLEIVVCDNASTDDTRAVVEAHLSDARVRYEYFDTMVSMPANFNRALRLARGDYVRFLCHDDALTPTCVSRSVAVLEDHPSVAMVTSHERSFGSQVVERREAALGPSGLRSGAEARASIIRRGNWVGGPTAVTLRASALNGDPFREDLPCSFDVEGWLRLLLHGDIYVEPTVLFGSRLHPGQATSACAQGGFRSDWFSILRGMSQSDTERGSLSRRMIAMSYAKNLLHGY